MITLTLPLNRMSEIKRCIAAERTSAARILRRNSTNLYSSTPRDNSHMPAFFSPSKQYRYADAIAASFFESRQTTDPRDLLVGDGVAAVVTIVDVTKRRILVVDVG